MSASAAWRTGRKVGRTIYAVVGDGPSDDDVLIGMMDTPELAQIAVSSYNALRRMPRFPDESEPSGSGPMGF